MIQFLTKYKDFNTSDAIKRVIESDGNFLILAYGYITPTENSLLLTYFEKLNTKLNESPNLEVEIHVGLLFNWNKKHKSRNRDERANFFISDHKDEVERKLKEFNNFNFSPSVKDRVKVFGIPNLHAKFCLNVINKSNFEGVSGAMGSSNLTNVARFDWGRTELDLYMDNGSKNEILQSFTLEIKELYEENKNQKFATYCLKENKVTFHESEAYMKELYAIAEAEDEYMREESFRTMYLGEDEEDRIARFESDRELGIYYDTEENLKKYYK